MAERKLTVLQVLPSLDAGGVERGVTDLAKYLVGQGHRSLVMAQYGRLVPQLLREGSEYFDWPLGRKSPWALRWIWPLRAFLQQQRVDIVHVRSRMPAWVVWWAWHSMPLTNRPHFITTVHGLYSVSRYSAVMMRGERVIAVSRAVQDYIEQHYPQVNPAVIRVIPRGVDRTFFCYGYQPDAAWQARWQAEYPQLRHQIVLTLPGRLARLKGHHDFVEVIRQLVASGLPVHGLIVGGEKAGHNRYRTELQQLIARHGLGHVMTLTGHRSDLREIMAVSRMVFSLSNRPESFGRTTLEALSLGVPVIGYAHGGTREVLEQVFPQGAVGVGDVTATVQKVQALLAGPPIVPQTHPYTLQHMLTETERCYQELTHVSVL